MNPLFTRALISCTALTLLMVAGCTSTNPSAADGSNSSPGASASVIQPPSATSITPTAGSRTSDRTPTTTSTTATIARPSVAESMTLPSTLPSGTSRKPASQEDVDRAAVEAQWIKYWDLYTDIVEMPQVAQPKSAAAAVAVEPALSNLSKSAEYFYKNGRATYGTVTHRLSWLDEIGGRSEAVLSDCQDQSKFGSLDVGTGKKLTVGVPRDNIKARFVKDRDETWRVSDIYFLVEIEC